MNHRKNRRVLVIDDNPSIQDDFRKVLAGGKTGDPSVSAAEVVLFGESQSAPQHEFDIDAAHQGQEGLEMVREARAEGRPYALAFVDIRMPPGMDGVETIEQIWTIEPETQFVICSAYSDYSASDILARLGISDRLLMLRKPCDAAEILLIATALCEKWNLARTAQELVEA